MSGEKMHEKVSPDRRAADTGAPDMEDKTVAVDPKLLEILVCPLTKSRLEYDPARQELISRAAGLAYPIRNGIPIMLLDEAREIGEG